MKVGSWKSTRQLMMLMEESSLILQQKYLPLKLKDKDSFTIVQLEIFILKNLYVI
jgi:hypothetical protein